METKRYLQICYLCHLHPPLTIVILLLVSSESVHASSEAGKVVHLVLQPSIPEKSQSGDFLFQNQTHFISAMYVRPEAEVWINCSSMSRAASSNNVLA